MIEENTSKSYWNKIVTSLILRTNQSTISLADQKGTRRTPIIARDRSCIRGSPPAAGAGSDYRRWRVVCFRPGAGSRLPVRFGSRGTIRLPSSSSKVCNQRDPISEEFYHKIKKQRCRSIDRVTDLDTIEGVEPALQAGAAHEVPVAVLVDAEDLVALAAGVVPAQLGAERGAAADAERVPLVLLLLRRLLHGGGVMVSRTGCHRRIDLGERTQIENRQGRITNYQS